MDLSRMGGDEFTVVLNQIESLDMAQRVAERLAKAIAEPFHIGRQEVIVTSSIGIALAPLHADDVEGLLRAADTAMINAKKRGRNRVLTYDDSMEGVNRERLQLENDLRKAIERDQLLLHYQPQVNARSGEVSGVESLVRWNHPKHGLVPPFKWIPMAEELGLIDDVGEWVLRKACSDLVQLRAAGFTLPKVSVNVSALQFHEEFVGTVKRALDNSGLDPKLLQLELTEGIMINDQDTTVDIVQHLKDLGLRLSIDDFGTGYSSLSYLTRFPLDELKIDRSFVLGLNKGKQSVELVRAIIAMGKSLGLEMVVEGVERVEELNFFLDQDVVIIQGFLFSPPVPIEKLEDILRPDYFRAQLKVLNTDLQGNDTSQRGVRSTASGNYDNGEDDDPGSGGPGEGGGNTDSKFRLEQA
jgi:predicted signal transduction protein with EAL and GGDEF domain